MNMKMDAKPAAKPAGKVGSGARFAALKAELSRRQGVTDPGGLAAYIGRRKFGAKRMGSMAAAGRKRSAG